MSHCPRLQYRPAIVSDAVHAECFCLDILSPTFHIWRLHIRADGNSALPQADCSSAKTFLPQQWPATPRRAAAAFFYNKDGPVSVAYISDAYRLLSPAVGTVAAKVIFGIALLASGQNSTITGTLSGGCTQQPGVCTASHA